MTIENNLASIAKSLEIIASVLTADAPFDRKAYQAGHNAGVAHHKQAVQGDREIVAAPIASQPLPNVQPAPTPVAPAMVTPVVNPVVAPVTPAVVSPSDAPFADHAALMTFVMDSYKALGPIKGAKIQDVLNSVGVKNINEVKPEHYAAIKAGVEALKV